MASEPELKQLFDGMEPSEQELARYRARLSTTLESRKRHWRGWLWLAAGGPLLATMAAVAWIVLAPPIFPQHTLEELEALVAASADVEALRLKAEDVEGNADGLERHNATMLLCLTRSGGEALEAAARGVVSDPRPEFRSFYLEYLLDHAEAWELDPERIEELMETEADVVCLDLYARLLRLAEWAPG